MENVDTILGDLLRIGGLSLEQKRALVAQARANISEQVQIFPNNPHLYMERLRALLARALFPQSGLLSIRREGEDGSSSGEDPIHLSRVEAWKALSDEFAGFTAAGKSIVEVRGILIGVMGMVMNSEVPLDLPPRWIAQAMDWIQQLTRLRNQRLGISLKIPGDIPLEGRVYLDAILTNMSNARKRADRQWLDLWATDEADVRKRMFAPSPRGC